jgi:hypothetical protein
MRLADRRVGTEGPTHLRGPRHCFGGGKGEELRGGLDLRGLRRAARIQRVARVGPVRLATRVATEQPHTTAAIFLSLFPKSRQDGPPHSPGFCRTFDRWTSSGRRRRPAREGQRSCPRDTATAGAGPSGGSRPGHSAQYGSFPSTRSSSSPRAASCCDVGGSKARGSLALHAPAARTVGQPRVPRRARSEEGTRAAASSKSSLRGPPPPAKATQLLGAAL